MHIHIITSHTHIHLIPSLSHVPNTLTQTRSHINPVMHPLPHILAELSPRWKALSDAETKVYNDIATKIKNGDSSDNHIDDQQKDTNLKSTKKKKTK